MKIGISGGKGSFSEEAAKQYCASEKIENPELVCLTFVEQVLAALEAGEIDRGLFAIENSNGGVVTEYLPAIAAHRFGIEKLLELNVQHMLLVLPGSKREDITQIVSQNQALRQCRMYLKRVWGETEITDYIDTATAAKDLHEGTLPKTAAVVASSAAGELYGLEVLDEGVQDMKFNYTVFIVATKIN